MTIIRGGVLTTLDANEIHLLIPYEGRKTFRPVQHRQNWSRTMIACTKGAENGPIPGTFTASTSNSATVLTRLEATPTAEKMDPMCK